MGYLMPSISMIQSGGWGAIALYLYSLFFMVHWNITTSRLALAASIGLPLLVMFLVAVFNHARLY